MRRPRLREVAVVMAAALAAGMAAAGPAPYPLVVAGGSGSGEHAAGEVVHIWADPAPEGSVFERWSGDVAPLIDRNAAHTTLLMPHGRVEVRALFRQAPGCSPMSETVHGVAATWCLPGAPKGLVLLFHSKAEGGGASFFHATESRIFVAEAAAAGFGLLAVDCADRAGKMWQLRGADGGPDVQNVRAVLAELERRHAVAHGEPLFAVGVVHGGGFAVHAARALGLRAVAVFGPPGPLPKDYATPTMWLMSQSGADRSPGALGEYTRLTQAHVPAKFEVVDASPVYPLRFWRIAGMTPDGSRTMHQLLADRGYLDAHDMLKEDPETSGWENGLPPRLVKLRGALREQLDVCFGVQRFYSDLDHRILDFFRQSG